MSDRYDSLAHLRRQPNGEGAEAPSEGTEGRRSIVVRARRRPRRPLLRADRHTVRRPHAPTASPILVLVSVLQWSLGHAIWRLLNLWDILRGRGTLEQKALRLQSTIAGIGPTGAKVGQQLGMRIDLMPLEYSLALFDMSDRAAPMAFDHARRRIEATVGAPLEEVFEQFEREPFSSTTAYCIYRATWNGRSVAVKVRRPGVRARFSADTIAVSFILWLLEASSIWRPGFLKTMREDLDALANERLNLDQQARYTTVFRRMVRRTGPSWLSSPRAHPELSSHAVMVTDYVEGVALQKVVEIADAEDQEALGELRAMGIDPSVVGRRLLQAAWWAAFENLFFVTGPTTKKVVVQPGNKLVFVGFEDSSMLSSTQKRQFQEMLVQLHRNDVSAAARSLVQVLSPLPFIDVFDFTKRIEAGLWQELLALRDDEALWWERTTIGVWRTVTRAARENHVSIRLDVLRFMASTLTYDTMAARLAPDLRLLKEFTRYRRRADMRAAKRISRQAEKLEPRDLGTLLVARAGRVSEGIARLGLWVESTVENLPVSNLALSGKAAYAVAQLVRTGGLAIVALGAGVAARLLGQLWEHGAVDPLVALLDVLRHPAFGILLCVLGAFTIRKVLYRLDDKGS